MTTDTRAFLDAKQAYEQAAYDYRSRRIGATELKRAKDAYDEANAAQRAFDMRQADEERIGDTVAGKRMVAERAAEAEARVAEQVAKNERAARFAENEEYFAKNPASLVQEPTARSSARVGVSRVSPEVLNKARSQAYFKSVFDAKRENLKEWGTAQPAPYAEGVRVSKVEAKALSPNVERSLSPSVDYDPPMSVMRREDRERMSFAVSGDQKSKRKGSDLIPVPDTKAQRLTTKLFSRFGFEDQIVRDEQGRAVTPLREQRIGLGGQLVLLGGFTDPTINIPGKAFGFVKTVSKKAVKPFVTFGRRVVAKVEPGRYLDALGDIGRRFASPVTVPARRVAAKLELPAYGKALGDVGRRFTEAPKVVGASAVAPLRVVGGAVARPFRIVINRFVAKVEPGRYLDALGLVGGRFGRVVSAPGRRVVAKVEPGRYLDALGSVGKRFASPLKPVKGGGSLRVIGGKVVSPVMVPVRRVAAKLELGRYGEALSEVGSRFASPIVAPLKRLGRANFLNQPGSFLGRARFERSVASTIARVSQKGQPFRVLRFEKGFANPPQRTLFGEPITKDKIRFLRSDIDRLTLVSKTSRAVVGGESVFVRESIEINPLKRVIGFGSGKQLKLPGGDDRLLALGSEPLLSPVRVVDGRPFVIKGGRSFEFVPENTRLITFPGEGASEAVRFAKARKFLSVDYPQSSLVSFGASPPGSNFKFSKRPIYPASAKPVESSVGDVASGVKVRKARVRGASIKTITKAGTVTKPVDLGSLGGRSSTIKTRMTFPSGRPVKPLDVAKVGVGFSPTFLGGVASGALGGVDVDRLSGVRGGLRGGLKGDVMSGLRSGQVQRPSVSLRGLQEPFNINDIISLPRSLPTSKVSSKTVQKLKGRQISVLVGVGGGSVPLVPRLDEPPPPPPPPPPAIGFPFAFGFGGESRKKKVKRSKRFSSVFAPKYVADVTAGYFGQFGRMPSLRQVVGGGARPLVKI